MHTYMFYIGKGDSRHSKINTEEAHHGAIFHHQQLHNVACVRLCFTLCAIVKLVSQPAFVGVCVCMCLFHFVSHTCAHAHIHRYIRRPLSQFQSHTLEVSQHSMFSVSILIQVSECKHSSYMACSFRNAAYTWFSSAKFFMLNPRGGCVPHVRRASTSDWPLGTSAHVCACVHRCTHAWSDCFFAECSLRAWVCAYVCACICRCSSCILLNVCKFMCHACANHAET